jgi:putative phosphoesterase
MKIAILSDIHANSDALTAVLADAKALGVSNLIIAGDFVGYYYNIQEVMALLSSWDLVAISGNHERLLLDWHHGENHTKIQNKYGSGIKIANEFLTNKQIQWLVDLPKSREFSIDNKTVLLCHGTPWDKDEYLYPDCKQDKKDKIFSIKKDLVVYGHTHYPVIHSDNNQLIVNPGSVGQTRDSKLGACWALWDTTKHEISLERANYNADNLIKQCQQNDPKLPYLQKILLKNNEN